MDPLRYNCSQLYGRPLYRGILLVFVNLSFSNKDSSLSKQNSKKEETVCVGPLNRSIELEEDRWKV
jgi:hypothetical protein